MYNIQFHFILLLIEPLFRMNPFLFKSWSLLFWTLFKLYRISFTFNSFLCMSFFNWTNIFFLLLSSLLVIDSNSWYINPLSSSFFFSFIIMWRVFLLTTLLLLYNLLIFFFTLSLQTISSLLLWDGDFLLIRITLKGRASLFLSLWRICSWRSVSDFAIVVRWRYEESLLEKRICEFWIGVIFKKSFGGFLSFDFVIDEIKGK